MVSLIAPLSALAALALPTSCGACGAADQTVCRACQVGLRQCLWRGGPRRCAPDPRPAGLPPVHSWGRFEGPLAQLLVAYKDQDRRDCAGVLGAGLAAAVDAAIRASPAALGLLRSARGPVLLVPVPSSRAARRRRGDAPLLGLCRAAVGGFDPGEVAVADALRQRRRVADQAGLGAGERALNLEHSMAPAGRWEPVLSGAVCVVADDVVTTGATLVEAARALRSAGAGCVVGATISATQRRRRAPSGQSACSR